MASATMSKCFCKSSKMMFCKGNLINSIEIRMVKMVLMMFAVEVLLPGIMECEAECPSDPNLIPEICTLIQLKTFNNQWWAGVHPTESCHLIHSAFDVSEGTLASQRSAAWQIHSRMVLIRYTLQRRIASPTHLGINETKCRQQYHLQASKDYPNLQSNIKIIWNPLLMIFSRSHLNE